MVLGQNAYPDIIEREDVTVLPLINSDALVVVDADLAEALSQLEWVLAGSHVISHSREGWQSLIDLAWYIGGEGATRRSSEMLDYRRSALVSLNPEA